MLENRYKLNYDIKSKLVSNITFKEGNIDSSVIQVNLINDGLVVDLTGESIEFRFKKSDNTIVFQDNTTGVTIIDALNGKVECVLMANTLAYVGEVKCEIYRSKDGKSLTTPTFSFTVEDSIGGEGILSTNYIGSIERLLININTAETVRVSAENVRATSETIRLANESNRITLYNTIQNKLTNGELKGEQGASGIVTGEIKLFAGIIVPALWHLCDGTILNKSEYPELHATIGFTYGGNGTTTFALPDLRGRFPLGSSTGLEVGTTHNNTTNITLTEENIPAHTHDINNVVTNNTNTVIPLSLEIAIPANDGDTSPLTNIPSNNATLAKAKAGMGTANIYTTNPPTTGVNLKPFTVQQDVAIPNQVINVASTVTSTGSGTEIDIAPNYLCLNYIIAL